MEGREVNFDHIVFNTKLKTFTIDKGSVGTYDYRNIKSAKVVSEDAHYTGKSEPFEHQVVVSRILQTSQIFTKNVHIGVEIVMKDNTKLYVYVEGEASQCNSLQWHKQLRAADEVIELIKVIVRKYKEDIE